MPAGVNPILGDAAVEGKAPDAPFACAPSTRTQPWPAEIHPESGIGSVHGNIRGRGEEKGTGENGIKPAKLKGTWDLR